VGAGKDGRCHGASGRRGVEAEWREVGVNMAERCGWGKAIAIVCRAKRELNDL
jgi:hypothetical protein